MPPVDFEVFEERLNDLPENKYKSLPANIPLPDRGHIEARMKEWKIKNWKVSGLDKDYDSLFDLYKDLLSVKGIKNNDIHSIIYDN